MNQHLIAKAEIDIEVSPEKVWEALTKPEIIKLYMFGSEVRSDWKKGSPIVWAGVWKGKPYEDKGTIVEWDPPYTLSYTHFSPLSGVPDVSENYHTVTFELLGNHEQTHLVLTQDNNLTEDERKHSLGMWEPMLVALKKLLEDDSS